MPAQPTSLTRNTSLSEPIPSFSSCSSEIFKPCSLLTVKGVSWLFLLVLLVTVKPFDQSFLSVGVSTIFLASSASKVMTSLVVLPSTSVFVTFFHGYSSIVPAVVKVSNSSGAMLKPVVWKPVAAAKRSPLYCSPLLSLDCTMVVSHFNGKSTWASTKARELMF